MARKSKAKNNKQESQETPRPEQPQVNQDLQGFNVQINEFGEIKSTYDIHKLNTFLDDNTHDKKFKGVEVIRRTDEDQQAGEDGDANWG